MLSQRWETSRRRFEIERHRNIRIPVRAGFELDCDIVRPVTTERVPVILCVFPFDKEGMFTTVMPAAISGQYVAIEGGDPNFYGRRGYAQVFLSLRGTGDSGGAYDHMGPGMIEDIYDAIEWLAKQPWCDGQVATFGTSFFSMPIKLVAQLKPPSLKAIFAPFGTDDQYRQAVFHGGIFNFQFHHWWYSHALSRPRLDRSFRESLSDEEWGRRVAEALQDPEIASQPALVEAVTNADASDANMYVAEYVLNPLDTAKYQSRRPNYRHDLEIPAYFGGDWAMHTLHTFGDFRAYQNWSGPKKLTIGPPYYLDRPVYQYAHESLRFFDYWLKGVDTEIMDEPPISLFIQNTGEWKQAHQWPLPETLWTEFYLHDGGLLSEHELFPSDSSTSFVESASEHGAAEFRTPMMVENTEVCGPLALHFFAKTTDTDVLWFVTVFQVDEQGQERNLTRGWLRGSQRRLDPEKSKPWAPYHPHDLREPLTPGEVYPFSIEIAPTGVLLKAGMRLGVRIKATDRGETPPNFLENHAYGHVWRDGPATVTVLHDNDHPSHLLVPVTRGNRIGTFMSGGVMPPLEPKH
ncbi:MAG TPA: CocE/NonD family hydrolase [Caulobacteraceae bacterium]